MIFERFTEAANQHRNGLAIVDGDQRITYGQLHERVAALRAWLQQNLNPRPGAVIAVAISNTWQFAASFFAIAELGAVFIPCNPQWRAAELGWLVERLGISGVIAESPFRAAWEQIGDLIPPQSVLTMPTGAIPEGRGTAPPRQPESPNEAMVYLTTSGSTGVPRIVPRSHRNLEAGAGNAAASLGIGPGHRLLSVLPFHHANGFHNCMLMPLLCGATLVVMPRFTGAACAELIRREKVNWLIGSPAVYKFLAESADPKQLSSLELPFCGGARLPEAVSRTWSERFGIRLRQMYGMAETSVITMDRAAERQTSEAGTYVGSPIAGLEVRVMDAAGNALGSGAVGEIAVRSDAVMSGYFGEPELNRIIFHDGFFRTGDSGCTDASGNLYLTGRIRRVINIGGVKVDAVEVEQAIEALDGVSECHVDTVTNSFGGEAIRARVTVCAGMPLDRRDVIEHCRQRLAEYKLPRIIEFVDSVPTTMTGKVPAAWKTDEPVR